MKKLVAGLIVWSVSSVALALPLTHGTYTNNYTGSYPNTVYVLNGGVGDVSASTVNGDSTAQAYASLLAVGGAPDLKVYADGNSTEVSSFAQGIQRYQYTGVNDVTLTVDGNFHALIDNSTSSIWGSVGLWAVSETETVLNDIFGYGSVDGYVYEGLPGDDNYGFASAYNISGEHNLSATASLELQSGDEFFLYGSLSAYAEGGVVNALSTGTFAFDFAGSGITSTDLMTVGAVSAVPVPAALYLFVPALLGLFGFKRKTA